MCGIVVVMSADAPVPATTATTAVTPILPCNDLDVSEGFWNRLGFARGAGAGFDEYRILGDGRGGWVHLTPAVPGWVEADRNPFGVYVYTAEVEAVAARVRDDIIERSKRPEHKAWGMYEFAVSDPDGVLVRVGWPSGSLD